MKTRLLSCLLLIVAVQVGDTMSHKNKVKGDTPNNEMVIEVCEDEVAKPVCTCEKNEHTDRLDVDCSDEQLGHARLRLAVGSKYADDVSLVFGVVNLKNMNLKMLSKDDLLPEWAPDVEELILDDNRIVEIDGDAFDDFGSLVKLSLAINKLHHFEGSIKSKIAKNLVALDLSNNKISSIKASCFGKFANLAELSLSGNPLDKVDAKALSGLRSLNILKLNECGLEDAHLGWLNYIDKLTKLELKGNHFHMAPFLEHLPLLDELDLSNSDSITEIRNEAFYKLSKLTKLTMNNMATLWDVDEDAFVGLHNLERLTMNDNDKFYKIDANAFGKRPTFHKNANLIIDLQDNVLTSWDGSNINATYIKSLKLNGNPWKCDCNLKWMQDDDMITKMKIADVPVCKQPDNLDGVTVTTVDADDLVCDASGEHHFTKRIIHGAHVVMWTMAALVLILAVIGAYIIKNEGLPCRPVGNGGTSGTSRTMLSSRPIRRIINGGGARDNDAAFDYRSLSAKLDETHDDQVPEMDDVYTDNVPRPSMV